MGTVINIHNGDWVRRGEATRMHIGNVLTVIGVSGSSFGRPRFYYCDIMLLNTKRTSPTGLYVFPALTLMIYYTFYHFPLYR